MTQTFEERAIRSQNERFAKRLSEQDERIKLLEEALKWVEKNYNSPEILNVVRRALEGK
jgi:hypothetical protein